MNVFRVLTIDGGGIRGIIPGRVLIEFERRTGKHIAELFDLIVGTSTGGILALGLTVPGANGQPAHWARDIVDLYVMKAASIFSTTQTEAAGWFGDFWRAGERMGKALSVLGGNPGLVAEGAGARYFAHNLEEELKTRLGDVWLDQALKDVVVTGYDMTRRQPILFSSRKAKASINSNFLMRDAARATSAAPMFFTPANIKNRRGDTYAVIDGGVFANNPTLLGYVIAQSMITSGVLTPEAQIALVSLGTGQVVDEEGLTYDMLKNWGGVDWAKSIMPIMFDGLSQLYHAELSEVLALTSARGSYWRFQTTLRKADAAMDNVHEASIGALVAYGDSIVRDQEHELNSVLQLLSF
jgi:patatin-like phospholipase/acyl hydrolase